MSVSLIILVCAKTEHLPLVLDRVDRQTRRPDELIIVDNGSGRDYAPTVAPLAARMRVVYQRISARSIAAARNVGLALAAGDLIAFTDDDCLPEPEWLERLVTRIASDARIGAVGGATFSSELGHRFVNVATDTFFEGLRRAYVRASRPHATPADQAIFFQTANVVFRRAAIDEAGRFDERFARMEDVVLCAAMRDRAWRLVYEPAAVIAHINATSTRVRFVKELANGRAQALLMSRDLARMPRRLTVYSGRRRLVVPFPVPATASLSRLFRLFGASALVLGLPPLALVCPPSVLAGAAVAVIVYRLTQTRYEVWALIDRNLMRTAHDLGQLVESLKRGFVLLG